jgi:hypothetical protein
VVPVSNEGFSLQAKADSGGTPRDLPVVVKGMMGSTQHDEAPRLAGWA